MLVAVGYRKDVFMFFVDRVELSEFLMKSFALLTMKSKPTVLMKFSATQKMKLNPDRIESAVRISWGPNIAPEVFAASIHELLSVAKEML